MNKEHTDKERLDWAEEHVTDIDYGSSSDNLVRMWYEKDHKIRKIEARTLRQAIDGAMG